MLAKQYRLQRDRDFERVFRKGRIFSSEPLFLKLRRNDLNITRFGFIIGKKISKKSTIRNKIKRRLREVVRKKLENIKPGFDVVIGAKKGIVDKNYQEIKEELEGLLKKAGVLR